MAIPVIVYAAFSYVGGKAAKIIREKMNKGTTVYQTCPRPRCSYVGDFHFYKVNAEHLRHIALGALGSLMAKSVYKCSKCGCLIDGGGNPMTDGDGNLLYDVGNVLKIISL